MGWVGWNRWMDGSPGWMRWDGTYVPVSRLESQKCTRCPLGTVSLHCHGHCLIGTQSADFEAKLHYAVASTNLAVQRLTEPKPWSSSAPCFQCPASALERRHATVQSRAAKQHLNDPVPVYHSTDRNHAQ